MAGEEKLLSDAVTVCSTSSALVHTTVVPGGTTISAVTKLKFSTVTAGPPVASVGCDGFGGGIVARAAGGTGVGSAALVTAPNVAGAQATSDTLPTIVIPAM